jgi:hypothetical protein
MSDCCIYRKSQPWHSKALTWVILPHPTPPVFWPRYPCSVPAHRGHDRSCSTLAAWTWRKVSSWAVSFILAGVFKTGVNGRVKLGSIFSLPSSFYYGFTAICLVLAAFSISWSYTQSVGIPGRGISPSQSLYLHVEQHKHRIKAHNTDIHALSGILTQDPSVRASEDSSYLRPRPPWSAA